MCKKKKKKTVTNNLFPNIIINYDICKYVKFLTISWKNNICQQPLNQLKLESENPLARK